MRFTIPGRPFGKARPRAGKYSVYNPKTNEEYENRVKKAYLQAKGLVEEPTTKPIFLIVECFFPIPKATPKHKRELMLEGKLYPLVRPDLDNCLKSVMDALNGLAYCDDKQIVNAQVYKKYSDEPKTVVYIGRYHP